MQSKPGTEPPVHRRGRGRAARRALLALAVCIPAQGCFTYRPAEPGSISPGDEVRVVLNEEEFRRVAPGALFDAPQRVEGDFLRLTADSLAVSVWIGEAYRGTPFEAARQEISIALADVVRVEHRQLSRWRTAVVAAGTLAAIATLIDGIGLIQVFGDGRSGGPPQPPAPELRPR